MIKSVDEIVLGLPKNEQVIVKKLRALVHDCLPKATEKISYGAPFYVRHRMICFIWPPSIVWGSKKQPDLQKGVTLGFCQGNRMANNDGVLLAEGRKQVYCLYIHSVKEINEPQIRALLFEAGMVDEQFARKKTKSKKR